MKDPAATAQKEQVKQQGFLASVITLPFRFFGVLCGSLLLSILIECIGLHFLWPDQGWHHAEQMLNDEMSLFSSGFRDSALIQEPGRTAHLIVKTCHDWLFVRSGLLDSISAASKEASAASRQNSLGFRRYLSQFYVHLENDLIASAYTASVFMVRLLVLCLAVPMFLLAAFVGLIDGLVRRDIRRFGAGRESGFVYHRAKASLMPLAVLPWVIYLALPISIPPQAILLPAATALGIAVDLTVGSFKKYL